MGCIVVARLFPKCEAFAAMESMGLPARDGRIADLSAVKEPGWNEQAVPETPRVRS